MNESTRIIFNKIYDLILKNKVIALAVLLITILIIFSFLSFSVDDDKVSINLEEGGETIHSENESSEKNQPSENLSDQEDQGKIFKKNQSKKFNVQFQKKNHLLQKNHKK